MGGTGGGNAKRITQLYEMSKERVAETHRGHIRTTNTNPTTLDYKNIFKHNYVNIYIFTIIIIIKGHSLREQSTLSAVSRVPFEALFLKFTPRTFHACATHSTRIVALGQLQERYLDSHVTLGLYTGFH
jgi:hypothetical protein